MKVVASQIESSMLRPYEPAKQNAVIELLHQQPLAPDAVEDLQQQHRNSFLGRNRGAAQSSRSNARIAATIAPSAASVIAANQAQPMILADFVCYGVT